MSNHSPQLLDLQTVALQLSVSPHTVRKWVKEGRLLPTRLCRRLLFQPHEIERLVADSSRPCPSGQR
jgi:predicted site-specific integrase-resolvase